ncbi:MAG: hypothetical protein ACE5G0_05550 [Rhodothermales bacterium]
MVIPRFTLPALLLILALPGMRPEADGQPSRRTVRFSGDPASFAMPYTDTLRALAVFVKFRDDRDPGDPVLNARDWPLFDDPGTLPPFATHLLAHTPTPPFPEQSLTAYFHQQSLGRFVLYGDVYDSVMVSLHPEAAYHAPRGGYGHLTAEILDRIDAQGFDFSPYDRNRDGLLDYLFVVIRRDSKRDEKRFTYTGISCLDAMCGGGITAGRPRSALAYDGLRIDWRRSGAIIMHRTPGNIIPHQYHVRMMAHELGHDLWAPFFNHIPAITDNDVPLQSNRGKGTDAIGYVLMAGAGGGWDARGDETISAFERDLLGWISCDVLTASQDSVVVSDLYTTSDCKKIILQGEAAGRILYLTNRQRLGVFDRERRGGIDGRFEMGLLRTTGLLITLTDGVRFDVLPADNTLDLSAQDAPYDGDLFAPSTSTQLTPWTRPSINGFTTYPPGYQPDWQAIDRIRYTGASGGEMAFDYIDDVRTRPFIREDSWIGDETRDYTFEAPMIVTNKSTLRIGTSIIPGKTLRVDPGATVVIEAGADVLIPHISTLDLAYGATLIVEGRLTLKGLLKRHPGAHLIKRDGGRIYAPPQ